MIPTRRNQQVCGYVFTGFTRSRDSLKMVLAIPFTDRELDAIANMKPTLKRWCCIQILLSGDTIRFFEPSTSEIEFTVSKFNNPLASLQFSSFDVTHVPSNGGDPFAVKNQVCYTRPACITQIFTNVSRTRTWVASSVQSLTVSNTVLGWGYNDTN